MSNTAKNDILATSLSVLHNYCDSLIKLFSDLYLAFKCCSKTSFFLCTNKDGKLCKENEMNLYINYILKRACK